MTLKKMMPTGTRNLEEQPLISAVGTFHDCPLHSLISSLIGGSRRRGRRGRVEGKMGRVIWQLTLGRCPDSRGQ